MIDSGSRTPLAIGLRVGLALLVGVLSASYAFVLAGVEPQYGMDFDPLRFAARGLLSGQDPYELIGPGRIGTWPWPLLYPLPAVVLVTPFVPLPLVFARALFVGLGGGLLAYLVTRDGWWRLPLFVSAAYLSAVQWGQWSPYLASAVLLPVIGFLATVKPNIGLAVLASARSWRDFRAMVIGCAAIGAVSIAVQPGWIAGWLDAMRTDSGHVSSYIQRSGGLLLLLAALRWRRPEARLLLVFALVPQNPGVYETVLLFLIPSSALGVGVLALATHVVEYWAQQHGPYATFTAEALVRGSATMWLVLFPCLFMLLRTPNEGPAPVWLERRIARWPAWLRGRPIPAVAPSTWPDA